MAVGKSVGASAATLGLLVVVDVGVSNVWTAILLSFAGRERRMDEAIGAERRRIDSVREKVERFQAEVGGPANLGDLLAILALGLGGTVVITWIAGFLPDIGTMVTRFTWIVCLATAMGVALSFTPLRRLEGSGASVVGTAFLYMLIVSIGAGARFAGVLDNMPLLAVGVLWMLIHASVMLAVRLALRAPSSFWQPVRRRTSAAPRRPPWWRPRSTPRSPPSGSCWRCWGTCSERTWDCWLHSPCARSRDCTGHRAVFLPVARRMPSPRP